MAKGPTIFPIIITIYCERKLATILINWLNAVYLIIFLSILSLGIIANFKCGYWRIEYIIKNKNKLELTINKEYAKDKILKLNSNKMILIIKFTITTISKKINNFKMTSR